ncbi:hypothetical protein HY628_02690 [Candidatus Uhrbacteria bacterium]|nr:hypothetical protein [Candidatus Uhrbacteria bacterium]
MKFIFKPIIFLATAGALLATPFFASAGIQLLPRCAVEPGQLCQLNDLVQTFVNFSRLLLGLVGSAVLFFFIYGGVVWLTSAGSADRVKKGKDIVVNSVIGLVIVFSAFTIIQFVFRAFQAKQTAQVGQACTQPPNDPKGKPGIYVPDFQNPKNPPQCVTGCGEAPLSTAGYACRDPNLGTNCISGLCASSSEACCQPLSSP